MVSILYMRSPNLFGLNKKVNVKFNHMWAFQCLKHTRFSLLTRNMQATTGLQMSVVGLRQKCKAIIVNFARCKDALYMQCY